MKPDLFLSAFLKTASAITLASLLVVLRNFIMPRVSSSWLRTPSPLRSKVLKECWS